MVLFCSHSSVRRLPDAPSGRARCAHSRKTFHSTHLILYCVACKAVVRARWAREVFDRLQPTAPGLTWQLNLLANSQGGACGARETELQVRAMPCIDTNRPTCTEKTLDMHFLCTVFRDFHL
jgi:hypothetical protein